MVAEFVHSRFLQSIRLDEERVCIAVGPWKSSWVVDNDIRADLELFARGCDYATFCAKARSTEARELFLELIDRRFIVPRLHDEVEELRQVLATDHGGMQTSFLSIYAFWAWGRGSGRGSHPATTVVYREFLQRFLREHDIKSVVDFGCGDWQFSELIDWTGIDYLGVEIVPWLVTRNRAVYGSPSVAFETWDDPGRPLPEADLLLVKDVLQHLPSPAVSSFLALQLPRFEHALLTNDIATSDRAVEVNLDIQAGGYRPLDLQAPPFSLRADTALEFELNYDYGPATERKRTLHHRRPPRTG